jgi:hypothetical protein
MTLDEALAEIRAMPHGDRGAAIARLARGMNLSIAGVDGWEVFDPLECTADMAARCWYGGRTMVVGDRVCAAVFDAGLPCPHAPPE